MARRCRRITELRFAFGSGVTLATKMSNIFQKSSSPIAGTSIEKAEALGMAVFESKLQSLPRLTIYKNAPREVHVLCNKSICAIGIAGVLIMICSGVNAADRA